jgi:putative PEP-CTERM system TPR-repeat lipoprotein
MRLQKNDLPGALKAIDALEKKTPDQPMPHLLRGRVLVQKKDVAGATRSFEAALAKDAAFFPAVASLAALDLAGGKPENAKARFEAFQKAQPKSFQAKLAMAELQARTGANSATVVATLREAVKINAGETLPHLILIRRLIAANDGKGALVAAQEASGALPNDIQIQEALGEAQIAAGDGLLAISTFKKLSSAQPKNTLFLIRLADAHRANKDPAAAELALKQALELDPDLTSARGALIGLALQAKRPQDALALARDQQKRKPNDPSGFQLEAEIEASRKNWDETVALLRTAAKLQNTPALTTRLHSALVSGGKTAEADRLAADWTRDHPKDMVFKFYLGDVAMARQDFPGAEGLYRQVLEAQPTNALALNNVAWLMARQNKPGAVAMAEKANALMPDRAPLVDTLSLALETENQLPKAIEAQVRASRLEPGDPNLTLRLGKLYIKSGDKARARAELETLVKLGDKFAGQAEVATLLKQL